MLLLLYRTLPEGQVLPLDQRWRAVELDPVVFGGLDLSTPQGVSAAIKRVNEGTIPDLEPFPYGSQVFLVDTDASDAWSLSLSVTKD